MSASSPFDNLLLKLEPAAAAGYTLERNEWDERSQMPPQAAEARARMSGHLAGWVHEAFVNDDIQAALCSAEADFDNLGLLQQAFVRRLRLSYDRAAALPVPFVMREKEITSLAQAVWAEAKKTNNYQLFRPHLDKILELTRHKARLLGGWEGDPMSLYTALLEGYEPGMTAGVLLAICEEVRAWLVPFIATIRAKEPHSDALLRGEFPIDRQRAFGRQVVEQLGYNLKWGNIATAVHPFSCTCGPHDHRITTRYNEKFLGAALYGLVHETGHALFESGVPEFIQAYRPVQLAYSLGIHESQSRWWENIVMRSLPASYWLAGLLLEAFPEFRWKIPGDPGTALYEATNVVAPNLIRVESDEVTYNLHIMLRTELEIKMVTGEQGTEDLNTVFADMLEEYLGIRPETDAQGVLQDVHWSSGGIGYFPTYMLGNLAGAQLKRSHDAANPDWEAQFMAGNFGPTFAWLQSNVHTGGLVQTLDGMLGRATGEALDPKHWRTYIENKFGALYGLPEPVASA